MKFSCPHLPHPQIPSAFGKVGGCVGVGGGGGVERVENCQAVYITIQHTLSVTSTDYMTDIVVSLCLCTVLYQTHELLCDSRTRRCFTGFYYWSTTSPNGMLLPSLCHICSAVISALSSSPLLYLLCLHLHRSVITPLSSSPPLYLLYLHLHRSVISAPSLCTCSVIPPFTLVIFNFDLCWVF